MLRIKAIARMVLAPAGNEYNHPAKGNNPCFNSERL
jgi:hypothetical protein